MTQEEKQLLIKDLSGRLPYGVQVFIDGDNEPYALLSIHPNKDIATIGLNMDGVYATRKVNIGTFKPYLRPMSSMTANEEEQWAEFMVPTSYFDYENDGLKAAVFWDELCNAIDWLNAHFFDYRGLILKGLALKAHKDMYNIKF